jgi:hypothetical protein
MMPSTRRSFLSTVGALAGATVLPDLAAAEPVSQGGWDMSWLDRITGKHRQVFDMHDMEVGLGTVYNWLEAHLTVYGLRHPDLSAVVGIGGAAFPMNATDPMYQKYPIGELWKVNDPATGKPALRNIFVEGGTSPAEKGSKVKPLQARGVIFWQCNNALHVVSARIAARVQRPEAEVYTELRAGLNPGVILIPAHTMLIGLTQEHGCAYQMV